MSARQQGAPEMVWLLILQNGVLFSPQINEAEAEKARAYEDVAWNELHTVHRYMHSSLIACSQEEREAVRYGMQLMIEAENRCDMPSRDTDTLRALLSRMKVVP